MTLRREWIFLNCSSIASSSSSALGFKNASRMAPEAGVTDRFGHVALVSERLLPGSLMCVAALCADSYGRRHCLDFRQSHCNLGRGRGSYSTLGLFRKIFVNLKADFQCLNLSLTFRQKKEPCEV
jgi:hypothetical protein